MTAQPRPLSDAARALAPARVTLWVCPICGTVAEDEHFTGGHDFSRFPDCHLQQRLPVVYSPFTAGADA